MDNQDFGAFVAAVDITCKNIRKPAIVDDEVLQGWFAVLAQYRLDQVKVALNSLVLDQESKYGITPALIDKHIPDKAVSINAKPETVMSIQAKAKVKKCPLGIMASAYMQPRSYTDMSSFDRNQLAAEFLELLPDMELKIQADGYNDRQMALLIKYKIDIYSPFRPGIAGPIDQNKSYKQYLRIESGAAETAAIQEAYRLKHDSVSEADMAAAKIRIAEDMATLEPKSKDQLTIEAAEIQAYQQESVNELVRGE